jgi:hypothetical protein
MNRFIQRVMIAFVGVFAVCVVAIIVYAIYWQAPEKRCEMFGNWWDAHDRVCAKPVFLPDITHRPIGAPKLKPGDVQPIMIPPGGSPHP